MLRLMSKLDICDLEVWEIISGISCDCVSMKVVAEEGVGVGCESKASDMLGLQHRLSNRMFLGLFLQAISKTG